MRRIMAVIGGLIALGAVADILWRRHHERRMRQRYRLGQRPGWIRTRPAVTGQDATAIHQWAARAGVADSYYTSFEAIPPGLLAVGRWDWNHNHTALVYDPPSHDTGGGGGGGDTGYNP